ncbi:DUF3558 family protein [Nocardia mangyaensis]|uniref:DUF3558 family protein n=1 Tax=Nocardia mangyaensis TaxID=2213200 RepID=UPI002675300C|nr:DUF3558 family protein [Nocardia mangyaensis]MDO3651249.1 DUF3558 family protein [Nocardia mangyaensis]
MVAAFLITATVAGCTSNDRPSDPIAVRISPIKSSVPIKWDPCTEVADVTVRELGFDPSTRRRETYRNDEETTTGCRFTRIVQDEVAENRAELGWLTVIASTVALDRLRNTISDESDTSINGRPGITIPDLSGYSCNTTMSGPDGTIAVRLGAMPGETWRPCDQIENAALVVESTLPQSF